MTGFSKEDTKKVKGLAIILMLFHHCFLSKDRYKGHEIVFKPFSEAFITKTALSMKICVCIFVFISAYGLTLAMSNYTKDTLSKMNKRMIKRWIRLMNGFFFIFLSLHLYSLVMGFGEYTKVYGGGKRSVVYFLLDGLGLAKLAGSPMLVGTFWYMSLAQIIIFTIPILIWFHKKFGSVVLLAQSVLFYLCFHSMNKALAYFPVYLFTMSLGVVFAEYDVFARIRSLCSESLAKRMACFCFLLILLPGSLFIRKMLYATFFRAIMEGICAVEVIYFCIEYLNKTPVLKQILAFIGKYSMDIFLIHNFIRIVWYNQFTYSFKYPFLIVAVLLLVSLGVSMILEWIKHLIRYDALVQKLIDFTGE